MGITIQMERPQQLCSCVCSIKKLSASAHYHIPNRFTEGYGLNVATIQQIADAGCDLLITVDCGITSVAEVVHANTLGIDVIVMTTTNHLHKRFRQRLLLLTLKCQILFILSMDSLGLG